MTVGSCISTDGSSICARVLNGAELVVVMGDSGPLKVIVGFFKFWSFSIDCCCECELLMGNIKKMLELLKQLQRVM